MFLACCLQSLLFLDDYPCYTHSYNFQSFHIICLCFSLAVFFPRFIFFHFFALYLLSDKQCLFLMLSPFSLQICLSILGSAFIYQHFCSLSLRDQSILCFFHQSFLFFFFLSKPPVILISCFIETSCIICLCFLFFFFCLFEFDSLFLSLNFYHPPLPFLKIPCKLLNRYFFPIVLFLFNYLPFSIPFIKEFRIMHINIR